MTNSNRSPRKAHTRRLANGKTIPVKGNQVKVASKDFGTNVPEHPLNTAISRQEKLKALGINSDVTWENGDFATETSS